MNKILICGIIAGTIIGGATISNSINKEPVKSAPVLDIIQETSETDFVPSPEWSPKYLVYWAKAGDTLRIIADKFEISVDLLGKINQINDFDALLEVGQEILIPIN